MGELIFFFVVPGLLSIFLVFLTVKSMMAQRPRQKTTLGIHDFYPIHHREYEVVQERLSEYEAILQRVNAEHRSTALTYLDAVREDFMRTEKLLNRGVKFLSEPRLNQELYRAWIGIQFRLEFRFARLKVRCGMRATNQLRSLTQMVRLIAGWADDILNQIAREQGLPILEDDLNR
jgi:hypothetical protein